MGDGWRYPEQNPSMYDLLRNHYDATPEEAAALREFIETIRFIESSGGTNLANPESSARGHFQALVGDGAVDPKTGNFISKPGQGQTSFQTMLNQYKNTLLGPPDVEGGGFRGRGTMTPNPETGELEPIKLPDWWYQAREANTPMNMSPRHQEDLFLANVYQETGTDPLFRRVMNRDPRAAVDLYMKGHVRGSEDPKARGLAERVFGSRWPEEEEVRGHSRGGFIRSEYDRTLI